MKIENLQRYDPKDITNGFCDYFASVGQSYADKLKSSSVLVETYNEKIPRENTSMFLTPTDQKEIKSIIMALPSKTSSGFDEISNKLLKQLCNCILEPLEIIFNQSMLQGEFPELMKNADVAPLYKFETRMRTKQLSSHITASNYFKNSRKIDISQNLQIHGSHWSNIQ